MRALTLILAAAALVIALVGAALVSQSSFFSPSEHALRALAEEPVAVGEAPVLDDEWEELLDFADSLWEWESPTGYLL